MRRLWCLVGSVLLVAGGCGGTGREGPGAGGGPVTLLFAGDLMLGRGVGPIARADPIGLFEDVRFVVGAADVAAANLESPLTDRPHLGPSPHALEADPLLAAAVARAGFDVLGIANNHAADAGAEAVADTIAALEGAGMAAVGDGRQPVVVERGGLRIAYLAFDATGNGTQPGIAAWDDEDAEHAVRDARRLADIVTVGVHGGLEYLATTDTRVQQRAEQLAGWGADVVWGHGPHTVQPVGTVETGERTTVVATSLGNFLFDQVVPGTTTGAVLEVLVGSDGVRAYRVGAVVHDDLRVQFTGWEDPAGPAVLFHRGWWNLASPDAVDIAPVPAAAPPVDGATVWATGDVTGDGHRELVVSFRRPIRETQVSRFYPQVAWADAGGSSAQLGVYDFDSGSQRWVAGSLARPVTALAVCDGAVALGFGSFEDAAVTATAAWVWDGFGFWYSAELPGERAPGCVDVDGDGSAEPAVLADGE